MKFITILLGILFSLQSFGSDTTLICNDQNARSTHRLILSNDLNSAMLVTLASDSSLLSSGTKILKLEEGESSASSATYGGRLNSGLAVAIILNSQKALTLRASEILEVNVYFQVQKHSAMSGNTILLCSKE